MSDRGLLFEELEVSSRRASNLCPLNRCPLGAPGGAALHGTKLALLTGGAFMAGTIGSCPDAADAAAPARGGGLAPSKLNTKCPPVCSSTQRWLRSGITV